MIEAEDPRARSAGVRVEPDWEVLLDRIMPPGRSPNVLTVLHVLGGSDSGKTTFCRWMGDRLADRGLKVAMVDCDPGQGAIGPPTTVGLAWNLRDQPEGPPAPVLRFVGDVNPSGSFLQLAVGIGALDRFSRLHAAQAVIFDMSGFMDTGAGREYHTLMVEATTAGRSAAGQLVALQRKFELEPVLRAFDRRRDVDVHRLGVSSAVVPRSREARRKSREARFRSHFTDSETIALPLSGRGRQGKVPPLENSDALGGLLVAPLDEGGFALGPHLITSIEHRSDEPILHLRGPRFDPARVTSVQFGTLRLDVDGTPLP